METTPLRQRIHYEDLENPLTSPIHKMSKPSDSKPRLLHPYLHDIPQTMRFPMAGAINTVGFMIALTVGDTVLKDKMPASSIYSLSSILYLPIGHAITSLFVFGWPEPYLPNLLMNLPIGMSGTAVGTFCTGMLVRRDFDAKVISILQTMNLAAVQSKEEEDDGQAYTNIMVIIITGIWGYVLSVMVNGSKPKKKHDKEL